MSSGDATHNFVQTANDRGAEFREKCRNAAKDNKTNNLIDQQLSNSTRTDRPDTDSRLLPEFEVDSSAFPSSLTLPSITFRASKFHIEELPEPDVEADVPVDPEFRRLPEAFPETEDDDRLSPAKEYVELDLRSKMLNVDPRFFSILTNEISLAPIFHCLITFLLGRIVVAWPLL